MSLQEALSRRILELCDQNGLTLNGLSYVCGLTQSTLYNIIGGRNVSTTISTVQKVCDGLEIDLHTFFETDLFRNVV